VGARSARTAGYNAWDVWTHGSLDRVDARTAGWRVEGCERGKTPARVVASECVVTRMLRPAVPRAARLLTGVMSVADFVALTTGNLSGVGLNRHRLLAASFDAPQAADARRQTFPDRRGSWMRELPFERSDRGVRR
jgi:hypothetical protein